MGKWNKKPIVEIAKINMGQSPDGASVNENQEGMPFLQGNADFGDYFPTEQFWCKNPKKVAIIGDVRAPVGEINSANQRYCIGRGLAAISFLKIIN